MPLKIAGTEITHVSTYDNRGEKAAIKGNKNVANSGSGLRDSLDKTKVSLERSRAAMMAMGLSSQQTGNYLFDVGKNMLEVGLIAGPMGAAFTVAGLAISAIVEHFAKLDEEMNKSLETMKSVRNNVMGLDGRMMTIGKTLGVTTDVVEKYHQNLIPVADIIDKLEFKHKQLSIELERLKKEKKEAAIGAFDLAGAYNTEAESLAISIRDTEKQLAFTERLIKTRKDELKQLADYNMQKAFERELANDTEIINLKRETQLKRITTATVAQTKTEKSAFEVFRENNKWRLALMDATFETERFYNDERIAMLAQQREEADEYWNSLFAIQQKEDEMQAQIIAMQRPIATLSEAFSRLKDNSIYSLSSMIDMAEMGVNAYTNFAGALQGAFVSAAMGERSLADAVKQATGEVLLALGREAAVRAAMETALAFADPINSAVHAAAATAFAAAATAATAGGVALRRSVSKPAVNQAGSVGSPAGNVFAQSGGGGNTYNINISGGLASDRDIAKSVVEALRSAEEYGL